MTKLVCPAEIAQVIEIFVLACNKHIGTSGQEVSHGLWLSPDAGFVRVR